MKKILASLFMISVLFVGCEKDITTEDTSFITHYVILEIEGESLMTIPQGGVYTEPGYSSMEGETDITGDVEVSGTVDTNTPGYYTLSYTSVNADGYSSTLSRDIIVYNPDIATDISGTYSTAITRTEGDGTNPRDYAGEINISMIAPGIFYVDCLLGGTYSIHYDYGPGYAMTGYLALNADNTLTLLSSYVAGWGDGLEDFQNGVWDEAAGVPYWESYYASGDNYAVTSSK